MKLYILNDNENSFHHVIRSIQSYLNYPYTQCESIANIVHNNGQCMVKDTDDEVVINEIYKKLVASGLKLRMESNYE